MTNGVNGKFIKTSNDAVWAVMNLKN